MNIAGTYAGVRVLDLATNFAGPYAAMILGDMGADVIKVERAPKGDDTRSLPPFAGEQATVFLAVNRNKRSIMLDFKNPADLAILRQLIEGADIVIESFPPGVADKLGLNWTELAKLNPQLLLASVSAFGAGPAGKDMPGYDALVQAVSGLMSLTGNDGEPTVRIAPSLLDLGTGMWTAMALMAALARQRAGQEHGEHITLALIDTAFNLMNHQLMGFLATAEEPRKLGSGAPSAAPYGVYRAQDGELLIATASEDQFQRLCGALGLQAAVNDPRFLTMADRIVHRQDIDRLIAKAVKDRTLADLLALLSRARISAGRVNSVAEAMTLPVVKERNLLKPAGPEQLLQMRLPLDDEARQSFRTAPLLDEHRTEILQELMLRRPPAR